MPTSKVSWSGRHCREWSLATSSTQQILDALVGSTQTPFTRWYAGLLVQVPPLHSFSMDNQAKIRKKLRRAADATQRDMQCELAVAAQLVAD